MQNKFIIGVMQQDLLILKLLRIPVAIIKFLAKSMAMLTYLPNYVLILLLDSIIFNLYLFSSATLYVLSWPVRLAALLSVIAVFIAEFYSLYALFDISHLHWGWQIAIMLIAVQIILALMRHGYLTMIKKFNPTKLKSPLEHTFELGHFIIDIFSLALTLVNSMLIVNIGSPLSYHYTAPESLPETSHSEYFLYIYQSICTSILILIKLVYVEIFFKLFPWRFMTKTNQELYKKQKNNIMNLVVLLTLIYLGTVVDIATLSVFGVYCYYIHPRRSVYRKMLNSETEKHLYKPTLNFVMATIIELWELLILVICLPFQWRESMKVIKMVTDSSNDYSRFHLEETGYVLKLALIKIPSLLCEAILFLTAYKYKKISFLEEEAKQLQKWEEQEPAAPSSIPLKSTQKQKYSKQQRHLKRQYLVFIVFGEFLTELPYFPLIFMNTIAKLHNIKWLKYVINERYDIRKNLVCGYAGKNGADYLLFLPAIIEAVIVGCYDPVYMWRSIWQKTYRERARQKALLPKEIHNKGSKKIFIQYSDLVFYDPSSATMPKIAERCTIKIYQDIFFIPLLICTRLSIISLMGCPHPHNSVELFEFLLMQYYIKHLKGKKNFNEMLEIFKADEAAGWIKTPRDRLRFWKLAYHAKRYETVQSILKHLMPKKMSDYTINNFKKWTEFSGISNYFWNQYFLAKQLLKTEAFFIIELIVTVIGILVLLPLTLWRMPTFFILFRTHKYKKSLFFKILFSLYKQMAYDIVEIPMRLFALVMFPRTSISFYRKTAFHYSDQGIAEFALVQKLKFEYVRDQILNRGWKLLKVVWEIFIVKILWVRSRDLSFELESHNIKVLSYIKEYLTTVQDTPTVEELLEADKEKKENKEVKKSMQQLPTHQKISAIVSQHFQLAIDDIPYLALLVFLLFTLPWRIFYIRQALYKMRDDKQNRKQVTALVKKISKDYQCLLLYFILILSIVKTKRAFQLIYRNFKINFYVGTLHYSHLKQLKVELKQAVHIYQSVYILFLASLFGFYRVSAICASVVELWRKCKEEEREQEEIQRIRSNTVKEGKQMQLLTKMSQQCLLNTCEFLDVKEMVQMTAVCKYFYSVIKERDEVWIEHWERVYVARYPQMRIKNDDGELSYNEMCIAAYKTDHASVAQQSHRDRLYALSLKQYKISLFQTTFDLKLQLRNRLPAPKFNNIFNVLHYNINDGFGPEQDWPRPDDNQEYLALMNITRRGIDQDISQQRAFQYWFFSVPVQFVVSRLSRFFNTDTHRRKKQVLFLLSVVATPFVFLLTVYQLWGWFWNFSIFIGYKVLFVAYAIAYDVFFAQRMQVEVNRWISLHPFDIKDDVILGIRSFKQKVRMSVITLKNLVKSAGRSFKKKAIDPVVKAIKWLYRKMKGPAYYIRNKTVQVYHLFVDRVAKPLYEKISAQIIIIFRLLRQLYYTTAQFVRKVVQFLYRLIKQTVNVMVSIARGVSNIYSHALESSLRLALKFGMLGELVFTVVGIGLMVLPSVVCYLYYNERWFIILSTLLTMVLMVTGYKHLDRMKRIKGGG